MEQLTFPKDAFLMGFLLRSSISYNSSPQPANYPRTATESASTSANATVAETSTSQPTATQTENRPVCWEAAMAQLREFRFDVTNRPPIIQQSIHSVSTARSFIKSCKTYEVSLEEKIKSLPVIKVTQEHVDNLDVCSVCMENFSLDEQAKKLPCHHLFHEPCITPWLKKRKTCPICRKLAVYARRECGRSRFTRFQPFRRLPYWGLLGHVCSRSQRHYHH